MGRGNDAIPTWSGFNYQGKMMLLYVLELINQIAKDKNKDIDAYSVELEKTEDFCIICDSEYKSFHQVKALAGNSITVIPGSYSGTLSQAQITSGWKNSSPNKVGEYYRDIELMQLKFL